MKILTIPFILFAFVGCNSATNESKQNEISPKDTLAIKVDSVFKPSPHVDSIDKVNALTIKIDGDNVNKASISKTDSSVDLTANMKLDHRIFGYEKPDTNSRKKLLLSVFTDDVKDNPFHLPDGAFYSTSDLKDTSLKFEKNEGNFVKVNLLKGSVIVDSIFIQKTWVEFDN